MKFHCDRLADDWFRRQIFMFQHAVKARNQSTVSHLRLVRSLLPLLPVVQLVVL